MSYPASVSSGFYRAYLLFLISGLAVQVSGPSEKGDTMTSVPAAAAAPARKRGITMEKREAIEGYIYILPWVLGFLLFTIGPMLIRFT